MREITEVQQFRVRGREAVDKIKSIFHNGKASEIKVLDEQDHVLFDVSSDKDEQFLKPTLDIMKGVIETIKYCKIVSTRKQLSLFA